MINEVTDELKCYSYRKNCDDCFKEKKFTTKYVRFFFYCTVCGSVASLSHTSEEGKTLLEYDSKEESLKFHLFYKFSDYVMFLFIHKRCCSRNFHDFWSCYSYILHHLHLLISCDKNLTNMFVVSISTL